MHDAISDAFRRESAAIVAALVRSCGNLELAEDALQDAFVIATERWPLDGLPANPGGWIMTTARRRLLDRVRRDGVHNDKLSLIARSQEVPGDPAETEDDRLRLIFLCAHPALDLDARVALTLRVVAGLSTAEIAAAFMVPETTMAQRISRAKHKVVVARIPFRSPDPDEFAARLSAVLAVVYLLYNQSFDDSTEQRGDARHIGDEAFRLIHLLDALVPNDPEIIGLTALMLLHDARRPARVRNGERVLLNDQTRENWDDDKLTRGLALVARAPRLGAVGQYWLQSAIVAEHMSPLSLEQRNWTRICILYDQLVTQTRGSVVVQLNRAIAVSMRDGPAAGLNILEPLGERLENYSYFHAARADCLARLNDPTAANAYQRAIDLAQRPGQRRSLQRALDKFQVSG